MDFINLKIFKSGEGVTFILTNSINDTSIISLVTELMTRDDGIRKRCFQDNNDLIIEMYGISTSIDDMVSKIINKTASNLIKPQMLQGICEDKDTSQSRKPDTSELPMFVPELLDDNVGIEVEAETENEVTNDLLPDGPPFADAIMLSAPSSIHPLLMKHPNIRRIDVLSRRELVELFKVMCSYFEQEALEIMATRKRKTATDFVRYESDTHLKNACRALAKLVK